ncbi:MAG: hypothetical protein WKG01_36460 [Kofleriaceae bacterium]
MWRAMLIGSLLLGCSFKPGQMSGDDDPIDARPDTPPDVPDGPPCFGTGAFRVCLTDVTPAPALTLPSTINTATEELCLDDVPPTFWAGSSAQPESCVIVAESITVATTVVTGARPLVLVATTSLTVTGTLDLSSKQGVADLGPAANGNCTAPDPLPGGSTGGGGGPGGSFQIVGGNGGAGADAAATVAPAMITFPELLRGGCRGTKGGGQNPPATGGNSGGAAYLVAGGTMTITGTINASGAGAEAGGLRSGGSGGGSGGMIVLWAAAFQTTGARLLANGGGGAAGGDDNTSGDDGSDPDPTDTSMQASGGSSSMRGGAGGRGYASPQLDSGVGRTGDPPNEGGGGGGGGGGYIKSNLALAGATVSPPPLVP